MTEQLVMQAMVLAANTVDGIEMGVLDDGTPYLTGRGLARAIGTTESTIRGQRDEWAAGKRDGKFAKLLASTGFDEPHIAIPVGTAGANRFDAYPEPVVMAMLEYYAFEINKPEAILAYRKLARAGFRLFVYAALGFDPASLLQEFQEFRDRLRLHALPDGYFSVFREMADLLLAAIQGGLRLGFKTIPDISVGKMWAKHWNDDELEKKYGPRILHEHYYPNYFPQSKSNPQDMNVYPLDALPDFRRWFKAVYIPERFPGYLDDKVRQGLLSQRTAKLLLDAVMPATLPAARQDEGEDD